MKKIIIRILKDILIVVIDVILLFGIKMILPAGEDDNTKQKNNTNTKNAAIWVREQID